MHGCSNRLAVLLVMGATGIWGCKAESEPKAETTDETPIMQPLVQKVQMIDWCPEHGVPESICTRCSASSEPFKKKGDWCSKHDLPESQCFVCHPELKQQFAAQYKATYGKEPPSTEPADATQ